MVFSKIQELDVEMQTQTKRKTTQHRGKVWLASVYTTILAIVLAEAAIFSVYAVVGTDDLTWHMTMGGCITALVAYPISYYIHAQKRQLARLTQELVHLAETDQMSGLLRRTAFLSRVHKMLHTPKSGPTAGSFLFVDADHFKRLNDYFGHATGDDAIKEIAQIIETTSPEGSVLGRLGGEEFGIFLPAANKVVALSVAENIRRKVRKLIFENKDYRQRLSVSIGGAIHTSGQLLSEFVQHADERMYLAKESGRNRIVFDDRAAPIEAPQKSEQNLVAAS